MEEEISLIEIGQVLAKRWKLMIFLPLIAALITYGASQFLFSPEYESSATLLVLPFTETVEGSGVVRHDVESTRQVVESCKQLTLSTESMQRIIGELSLNLTANELRESIDIKVGDVTTIAVIDNNPNQAYAIAEHVTQVMMSFITDTARLDNVQLLNPAQVPTRPVNQRGVLNMAVAFVLAFMVAVALAFLFEHLDNTIKTSEDVQKYLGVPVLGVIPDFEEDPKEAGNSQMTITDGQSAASEAYRTLRTNVQFTTVDSLTKSLLVVGAHPACGKTTTVTNLGLALAQAGSSVLLVDTDLRRPRLHDVFNLKNFFGLTTMLIEEDLNMNAARHKTPVPYLEIIPSGPVPPNPAELLASRKMLKALKEFQNRYDYVILDSPPMLNVADASILAQMCDATVLVVAYAETTKEEAQKVHQQLQMAKANLIGVVINGIPPHLNPYGYYGYYDEEPVEEKPKKEKKRRSRRKKRTEDKADDFDVDFDKDKVYRDF